MAPHAVIQDGLMTIFFFVVGMEIKRELAVGELRTLSSAMLPAIAARGGMLGTCAAGAEHSRAQVCYVVESS